MNNRISLVRILAIVLLVSVVNSVSTWAQDGKEKSSRLSSEASPDAPEFVYPRIKDYGKVVRLPKAVDQPRNRAGICVDITAAGPAEKVNTAIEKVARFINIYAGAGSKPAEVRITVILHGHATLTALSAGAYAERFQLDGNPNVPLLRKLKEAGVEILVCGQAISHKGVSRGEIAKEVGVAVSALTVNVNRQLDGYAFIPLH